MNEGKNFMFRSAAALTKVIGGVSDKALLTREELIKKKQSWWFDYYWFPC